MRAFLYHVLNNLIIDEYRKHTTASLDALIEKGFEPSVDDSASHFSVLDAKIPFLLIQDLPEKYRAIMDMRYKQELSLKEMSFITGQSRNTIAVQIHRGLGKLKLLYKPT
jgi:RNA polymerase sigma factor (sigma-70 family)